MYLLLYDKPFSWSTLDTSVSPTKVAQETLLGNLDDFLIGLLGTNFRRGFISTSSNFTHSYTLWKRNIDFYVGFSLIFVLKHLDLENKTNFLLPYSLFVHIPWNYSPVQEDLFCYFSRRNLTMTWHRSLSIRREFSPFSTPKLESKWLANFFSPVWRGQIVPLFGTGHQQLPHVGY